MPRPTPPLLYRVLTTLAWPVLALVSARHASKARDKTLLAQRLGVGVPTQTTDVWCHCASVGEVNTAAPLIEALLSKGYRLHITTVTATGATTARKRFGERVPHSYLPVDTASATRRFFNALRPRLGLITETEIWPQLYAAAERADVALVVVNARVSPKTAKAPNWWRPIMADAVGRLERVLARSARDASAWHALGVDTRRIEACGNLKYAALHTVEMDTARLLDRPYWLAASTHADEERDIAAAWTRSAQRTGHTLVIVPRHIERAARIKNQLLELDLTLALRSDGDPVNADTDVLIADTFGELNAWYAHASAVFVGGSLCNVGGHNVLEAAVHGRWIATGHAVHNFQEEIDYLAEHSAITRVQTAEALVEQVCSALENNDMARLQGERARSAVKATHDVLPRYLDAIDAVYASTNARQPDSS
ncbi:MAG: glycosyltransferase N-terminal domain-containing protein [Pseudomonadota bacterium]